MEYIASGAQCAIQASGIGALSFASDNTNIVTVNASGIITGISDGTAKITVTAAGNANYQSASTVISVSVETVIGPEVCGPNIDWSISNGVLRLTGSGPMFDWPRTGKSFGTCDAPWSARCGEITSVVLSDQITSIGANAFKNCSGLTSITIPSSVTSIGQYAFSGCSGLTSMTLPFVGGSRSATGSSGVFGYIFGTSSATGLTEVKQCYISGSSDYTTRYIPSGLKTVVITDATQLSYGAFYNCSMLTIVTLPSSVTTIGSYAFYYCSGLTSVTIPSNVTTIGQYTFYNCSGLNSVMIPSVVTSIGSSAFSGCSGLINVTIPNSVTSIGQYAFYECSGLTSVTIPSSVTIIEWGTFYGCSGLTSITIPGSVTSIEQYAFSDCSGLTSITIPSSVTSIGQSAFSGCSGLTSMTLPFVGGSRSAAGLTGLFGYIFGTKSATGLTYVKQYYDGGWSANYYYIPSSLKSVVITNANKMSEGTFYGCSMLTNVTIPSSVSFIGNNAFYNCRLTIHAPSSIDAALVQQYGGTLTWAYYDVLSLENAVIAPIPDQLYTGSAVVPALTVTHNDDSLTTGVDYSVSFTDNQNVGTAGLTISGIGKYAGTASASFNIVPLPLEAAVITGISEELNVNAPFTLNPSVTVNGRQLTQNTDFTAAYKTDVNGNAAVTITGQGNYTGTAQKYYRLIYTSSLILPNTLTTIEEEGFANSACLYVVIPDGCKSIGSRAFANCANLCRVWIPASVTSISADAFSGCSANLVIIAPLNSPAHQFAVSNGYRYEQAIK